MAQESGVPVVRGSGNLKSGEECLEILERGDFGLAAIMKVGLSFVATILYAHRHGVDAPSLICMHSS